MKTSISLWVPGHPATQGSKKGFLRGKKIILVEMDTKLPGWRKAITQAAKQHQTPDWEPLDGPLEVTAQFYLPEPKKSIFGKWAAGPPDLDKLQRALGDALTQAHIIQDDARIVTWHAYKLWDTNTTTPGVHITVTALNPPTHT